VVEPDLLEVPEKGRHVQGYQSCRQQRSILEVQVMRILFDERPQVCDVDLLQHRHDQVLLRHPLKAREQNDCNGIEALDVRTVRIQSQEG